MKKVKNMMLLVLAYSMCTVGLSTPAQASHLPYSFAAGMLYGCLRGTGNISLRIANGNPISLNEAEPIAAGILAGLIATGIRWCELELDRRQKLLTTDCTSGPLPLFAYFAENGVLFTAGRLVGIDMNLTYQRLSN